MENAKVVPYQKSATTEKVYLIQKYERNTLKSQRFTGSVKTLQFTAKLKTLPDSKYIFLFLISTALEYHTGLTHIDLQEAFNT